MINRTQDEIVAFIETNRQILSRGVSRLRLADSEQRIGAAHDRREGMPTGLRRGVRGMNELERAAIAYAQAHEEKPRSLLEGRDLSDDMSIMMAQIKLSEAARAFAASLETVKPGLDPTPRALARGVIAKVGGDDIPVAFEVAETLARAVLESEREPLQGLDIPDSKLVHDAGIAAAEAYARGRVDGAEAERKAAQAVYESREEHAKRADQAEAYLKDSLKLGEIVYLADTELLKSLEWSGRYHGDGETYPACPCCEGLGVHTDACKLKQRIGS